MANRYMKRCSISLIIRKMQMKTTVKYHLTHVRVVIIKKTKNKKFWPGCGENVILMHCWWKCKLVEPLWKTVWGFLKQLQMELPCDSAIQILGIYLKTMKTLTQKDTCIPMFTEALFPIFKTWKQSRCLSMEKWIKKMWYVHTYTYVHTMEYYSDIKRNEILPLVTTLRSLC